MILLLKYGLCKIYIYYIKKKKKKAIKNKYYKNQTLT